ncbi:MAG: hypothetical protein FWB96_11610, partial [Defluviitaleaceae bacterium]|nr:hypothetical protein [Defluviitaleaceae bacterium]MCL2263729.1 hypothetical protein [Defluviitaleaceae bacterium]
DDGTVFPLSYLMELRGVVYGTDGDDEINVSSPGVNTIFPMGGNDIITVGGDGTNTIYATRGSNKIFITGRSANTVYGSLDGNDIIVATGTGRNIIDPGFGDNVIYAGTGSDTFIIGRGYGINRITANGGFDITRPRDRLVLKDGIRPAEVRLARYDRDLVVRIVDNSLSPSRTTFIGFFSGGVRRRLTDITFDCGTVFTTADIISIANDNRVTESPSVYIDEISEFYTYAVEGDGSTPSSPCDDTNAIS